MPVHSTESFLINLLLLVVAIGLSVLIWRNMKRETAKRRKAWEENPPPPAFVELGGDGGEQSFYVKRDPADETVYVLDLEMDSDYTKPRPYASDIDHWVALRLQDHLYE